jgi:hypothetical protein
VNAPTNYTFSSALTNVVDAVAGSNTSYTFPNVSDQTSQITAQDARIKGFLYNNTDMILAEWNPTTNNLEIVPTAAQIG